MIRRNVENHIASDASSYPNRLKPKAALLVSWYYLSFSYTLFYPFLLLIFSFILNGRSPSVYGVQIFARISAILTQVVAVFLIYSRHVELLS
jgi:hypothetical protein